MSFLNIFKGLAPMSAEAAARFLPGITQTEVVNAASGNAAPATILNSRLVSVDTDGVVKFDFKDDQGNTCTEVKYMAKGTWYHYRNVSNVYRYYTGTTAITTTVYGTNGVAVAGLKVHR
jgi:hypothetical protein